MASKPNYPGQQLPPARSHHVITKVPISSGGEIDSEAALASVPGAWTQAGPADERSTSRDRYEIKYETHGGNVEYSQGHVYRSDTMRSMEEREPKKRMQKSLRSNNRADRDQKPGKGRQAWKGFLETITGTQPADDYYDQYDTRWQQHHDHDMDQPYTSMEADASLSAKVHRLRTQRDDARATVVSLEQALESERINASKLKVSADHMQKMMDNKDLFVGHQTTDDTLVAKFDALMKSIRTWATKFNRPGKLRELDNITHQELETVAPGCTGRSSDIWDQRKLRIKVIRGWVGFIMAENIFRSRPKFGGLGSDALDQWMGETMKMNIATLEDCLISAEDPKIPLQDLHNWRALTIELLARIDLGDKSRADLENFLQRSAKRIMQVVGTFAEETLHSELTQILLRNLRDAVQLSQVFRKQRACWIVKSAIIQHNVSEEGVTIPSRMQEFQSSFMVDDEGTDEDDVPGQAANARQKHVVLFVTPGLFKCGNSDGEDYDHQSCLCPLTVLCR